MNRPELSRFNYLVKGVRNQIDLWHDMIIVGFRSKIKFNNICKYKILFFIQTTQNYPTRNYHVFQSIFTRAQVNLRRLSDNIRYWPATGNANAWGQLSYRHESITAINIHIAFIAFFIRLVVHLADSLRSSIVVVKFKICILTDAF